MDESLARFTVTEALARTKQSRYDTSPRHEIGVARGVDHGHPASEQMEESTPRASSFFSGSVFGIWIKSQQRLALMLTARVEGPRRMMMLTGPTRAARTGESPTSTTEQIQPCPATRIDSVVAVPSTAGQFHPQGLCPLQLQAMSCELVAMINDERVRRGVRPLEACKSLDTFAGMEAEAMAETGDIMPWFQSLQELEQLLKSSKVGENIGAGDSVQELHANVVADPKQCQRFLSKDFTQIGVAVSLGCGNKLYMCQLFRDHEAELAPQSLDC